MSKEIFLYSEDKKYKCAVELADSLDRFNCPDHSVMILFEERENDTYIIAQARDKRLETEKDTIIDDLKMHNADFVRELVDAKNKISDLEAKLAESENKVKEYATEITRRNTEQIDMQTRSFLKIRDLDTEILKLKQQLVEKEEQVRKSQEMYFETLKEYDELEDNFNNTSLELWAEKIINQDKISFAVERFEKLKEDLDLLVVYGSENVTGVFVDVNEVKDKILAQIKLIKEME